MKEKEQITIPIGTLVQVRKSALKDQVHGEFNQGIVAEHGWLWVLREIDLLGSLVEAYTATSIATGNRQVWLPREITAAPTTEENTHG